MSKKTVGIFVLSILFLSFLSTFALAQGIGSKIFDPIKSMFTDWEEGNLSINIAKYLLTGLVFIFVYGVTKFLPIVKGLNKYIQFLFALVVAFLSMAFTSSSDLYAVMVSYTAMGFVMSAIVPMMILIFFSIEMSKENFGSKILARFMWFLFVVVMAYKLIEGYSSDQIKGNMLIAYIAVIVFTILWIWKFEKKFVGKLIKEEFLTLEETNLRDNIANLTAQISDRDKKSGEFTGSVKGAWTSKTNEMRRTLKELERALGK